MREQRKERRESFLEKLSNWLNLPGDALAGMPQLELLGDRELRLENYRSILFFGKEEIHVDGGKWTLHISGRDLEIRVMRERELLIIGWIDALKLL